MKFVVCLSLLIALSPSVSAEDISSLDKSKAIYEKSLRKIDVEYQARKEPLEDLYHKSLIQILWQTAPCKTRFFRQKISDIYRGTGEQRTGR